MGDSRTQLAQRGRVAQQFHVLDVLGPTSTGFLKGRHAVALHACGELHRHRLRQAVAQKMAAIEVVPCCYHLGVADEYLPFSGNCALRPRRDDLRLAVTQTMTAAPREVERRNQEMAWKLGFDSLRRDLAEDVYRPIKPINKQWLKLGFAGFCHVLAMREELALPEHVDWLAYEQLGWQRQRRVMRLNLVRLAFARALVLDMAAWLEGQAYTVGLACFCDSKLTPRNVMLSARQG